MAEGEMVPGWAIRILRKIHYHSNRRTCGALLAVELDVLRLSLHFDDLSR